MLSRFSVKKPYTVLVGVILAIILGVVSLTHMTADLLPSMNMPYAVVYTTYIGASPEEVESTVTQPVESAMATVSNIENIQSVSSENVSMVILEFGQTANMDSVSIEMRESLDQISSMWPDSVGNPIIMKLNPDMMPVMVAAVAKDGLTGGDLTDYVENELLSDIESIEGVASVATSGEISESVQVILSPDKIAAKNQEIRDALADKFSDARDELNDARQEIEDGLDQIEEGSSQMEAGKATIQEQQQALATQIAQARAEMDTKKTELLEMKLQLTDQISKLTDQLSVLEQTEKSLQELKTQRDALAGQKAQLEEAIGAYQQLAEEYAAAAAAAGIFEEQIAAIENNPDLSDEEKQAQITAIQASEDYQQAQKDLAAAQMKLNALGITADQIEGKISELSTALQTISGALAQLDGMITAAGQDPEKLEEALAEIAAAKQQIQDGIKQLEDTIAQLESGQIALSEAETQLNVGEATGNMQIYSALAELIAGKQGLAGTKTQLESGLKQLDSAEEQVDDQEESAYEKSDLTDILTRDMVSKMLTAQNFSMPAGYITEGDSEILVRVGDKFSSQEDIENLVLMDMGFDDVEPIRIGEVADVVTVNNSADVYASINGEPGILLTMQKQTGYSTGEVSDRIQETFDSLSAEENGPHFTILMDQGIYMDMIINSVVENMLFGALLAILVLIVFMKSLRPTIMIACSIPLSILTAILLMYFSGISINIISLSGLALGIGMLVDNSIVVIENIYRMRSEGLTARKAAVEGARQVAGAITASTLTTICVFLPIVFTEGITRQLFVDMGLTIAYSLLASLFVALTLVPAMSSGLLMRGQLKPNRTFERIQNAYSKSIVWILKRRALVLVASLAMLVISIVAALSNGTSFMPKTESTQMSVTLETEKGSTLEETAAVSEEVITRIQTLTDVEAVGAMAGSSGMMSMGSSNTEQVTMYLILKEDKDLTNEQLKAKILDLTADLPCEIKVETSMMDMSALGGSGVSIEIKGKELDKLKAMAKEVAALVEGVDGTEEVSDGMDEQTQELRISVNKEKASEHNLTVAQVYAAIYAKLSEAKEDTTLVTESKDYPVYVMDGEAKTLTRDEIGDLTISVTNTEGEKEDVAIRDVADFTADVGLPSIRRNNQQRTLNVTAVVSDGYNVGLVGEEVQKKLDSYQVPNGYSVALRGENETINESMTEMMKMLALAVVFVYLVMVAQFQSLLSPFIIMFTIPLAFTGGFLALFLAGFEVSVISMIGFVMLAGVIVNNGIVMVDYINQLRRGGMDKKSAIAEAGRTRLRPILMTAVTTIFGLLTMAFGMGMGADMVQPMAIVTIGGMVYGTLLTLWVVPCIYDLLNRETDMTEEEV